MLKLTIYFLRLTFFLGIIAFCCLGIIILYYSHGLPSTEQLKNYRPDLVSKIYASNGQLLEEYAEEYRIFIPIKNIPPHIIKAFLAAEDSDYFNHPGINIKGLARASIQNITNIQQGKSLVGGSTITQQVIKNLLLSKEKSLDRKIKEAILALRLNYLLSKEEVLELYLNHIYLGNRAYGIASAAAKYFNKTPEDLTISEVALLASLPKAPSFYNPKIHQERILDRRNWVLYQMLEKGFINESDYVVAVKDEIKTSSEQKAIFEAGYFSNDVRNIIAKKYGENSLFVDGLIINTTIVPEIQILAQEALKKGIDAANQLINDTKQKENPAAKIIVPEVNGAIVVINNKSGRIIALVGGYDFNKSQFNRATQATRQPGSSFKPFVYLTALENGFSPIYKIDDMPIEMRQGSDLPMWLPKNFSDDFLGSITLRRALELSRNAATINLAKKVGLSKISDLSIKIGVTDTSIDNYSAVLGAIETKLINLTSGYATFANGGKKIEPVLIETIQDRNGKVIFRNPNLSCYNCTNSEQLPTIIDNKKQIISSQSSFQLVKILQGAVESGTSRKAKILNLNIGGKTGTTNENKDAWYIGFNSDYTIGIFVGYDTPQSMGSKASGANIALPIFIDFMESIKHIFSNRPFKHPQGIKMVKIDASTGRIPDKNSKSILFEALKTDQQPNIEKSNINSDEINLLINPEQIY
jgi:penicillin-binding protein 1A